MKCHGKSWIKHKGYNIDIVCQVIGYCTEAYIFYFKLNYIIIGMCGCKSKLPSYMEMLSFWVLVIQHLIVVHLLSVVVPKEYLWHSGEGLQILELYQRRWN